MIWLRAFVMLIGLWLSGFGCAWAEAQLPRQVHVCEDAAEWPPYSYRKVVEGKESDEVVGFSVDVLRAILEPQGIGFDVALHPWKRCLKEVQKGELFQVILSASFNEERYANFYLSDPYYQTRPYFFYSKQLHPDGLPIKTIRDLSVYVIGGIAGYNYQYLGAMAGKVNTDSIDYRHLILKLKHQKVDVFVEQYEVMLGAASIGRHFLSDPDLGYAPLEDVPPVDFQMMFPRTAQGQVLRDLVNQELKKLRESGRLQTLYQHYFR